MSTGGHKRPCVVVVVVIAAFIFVVVMDGRGVYGQLVSLLSAVLLVSMKHYYFELCCHIYCIFLVDFY